MPEAEKEPKALLIQYSSPIAAATLPRYINNNTDMQAASPAYEIARLFTIIGVGVDVLREFALMLLEGLLLAGIGAALGIAFGVGVVAALLPAWRAYRTDIAATLARG